MGHPSMNQLSSVFSTLRTLWSGETFRPFYISVHGQAVRGIIHI